MLYIQESPENVSGKSTIDQFEISKEIRMPRVKCRKILELSILDADLHVFCTGNHQGCGEIFHQKVAVIVPEHIQSFQGLSKSADTSYITLLPKKISSKRWAFSKQRINSSNKNQEIWPRHITYNLELPPTQ